LRTIPYNLAIGAHERISEVGENPGALTNDSIYKGGGPDPLGAAAEHNRFFAAPNYIFYQQVETIGQLVRNQQVGGSIPLAGSTGSPILGTKI